MSWPPPCVALLSPRQPDGPPPCGTVWFRTTSLSRGKDSAASEGLETLRCTLLDRKRFPYFKPASSPPSRPLLLFLFGRVGDVSQTCLGLRILFASPQHSANRNHAEADAGKSSELIMVCSGHRQGRRLLPFFPPTSPEKRSPLLPTLFFFFFFTSTSATRSMVLVSAKNADCKYEAFVMLPGFFCHTLEGQTNI